MTYLQKKKLAFMSIVNQVKGFVRSVSGTLPLTLEDCVDEESIIDYKIYGQSMQDGEPTPNNPIEVKSVGEYNESIGKYEIPVTISGTTLIESNFENCNLGTYTAANQKSGSTDLRNGLVMTSDSALSTGYTIKNGSKYESISEADIVSDGGTKVLRLNTFLGSDYDHVDNTKYPVVKSDEALPIKGKIRIDLEVKTTKGAAFWLYHTSTTDGGNYRLWKLESGGTKATRLKVFDNTNTGKAVSCDVYNTYTVIMDNTAGTAEFYLNGMSIYTGTLPKIPSSSNWQLYFK
jgi:hypothetical protein